jgi:N-acyl-L-homoserine lactone synthetase
VTYNNIYRFSQAHGELRKSAIALHRQRYQELGFMPEGFQDPYERDSIYFVAQHAGRPQVIGVCRLVIQDLRMLATYAHFELFEHERKALTQLKPGTYSEFGGFTKLPHHHDIVPGLLATALSYASARGMTHLLCCVDQQLSERMRMFLDLPLRDIGNARQFYGSLKIPCTVSIPEALSRLGTRKPQVFQHLSHQPAIWKTRTCCLAERH